MNILAMEFDRVARTVRYWDGEKIVTLTGQTIISPAFTTIDRCNSLTGVVTWSNIWCGMARHVRGCAERLRRGDHAPFSLTRLLIEPIITQSEGRPKNAADYYLLMRGGITDQAVYVAGMRCRSGPRDHRHPVARALSRARQQIWKRAARSGGPY